jgi:hypothetical protein
MVDKTKESPISTCLPKIVGVQGIEIYDRNRLRFFDRLVGDSLSLVVRAMKDRRVGL